MSRTSKITALYERLSRDDDLNGESVIPLPIRKNTSKIMPVEMALTNIRHFTDDGFSGVNFNRPRFSRR